MSPAVSTSAHRFGRVPYTRSSRLQSPLNVLDVPTYDNGYGVKIPRHRKTVYIDAGPELPIAPTRYSSVDKTQKNGKTSGTRDANARPRRLINEVQPCKPVIKQPRIRPMSHKVNYMHADDDFDSPRLDPKKNKSVTRLHPTGPAPGMHKYVNRKLPPLPKSNKRSPPISSMRQIQRIQSRSDLFAACANSSQTHRPHTQMGNAQLQDRDIAQSRMNVVTDVVNYHLDKGKVTKFDPQIYTSADRREIELATAAINRYDEQYSSRRPVTTLPASGGFKNGKSRSKSKRSFCSVM